MKVRDQKLHPAAEVPTEDAVDCGCIVQKAVVSLAGGGGGLGVAPRQARVCHLLKQLTQEFVGVLL